MLKEQVAEAGQGHRQLVLLARFLAQGDTLFVILAGIFKIAGSSKDIGKTNEGVR